MKRPILTALVFLFSLFPAVHMYAGDFEIKFGVLKAGEKGKYSVSQETAAIPLRYKDEHPDFRFGYSIKSNPDVSFTTFFLMHFPSEPGQWTGDLKNATKTDVGKVVLSPTKNAYGEFTYSLRFDRGDPPGQYKIDIYINDKLARSVDFPVTSLR